MRNVFKDQEMNGHLQGVPPGWAINVPPMMQRNSQFLYPPPGPPPMLPPPPLMMHRHARAPQNTGPTYGTPQNWHATGIHAHRHNQQWCNRERMTMYQQQQQWQRQQRWDRFNDPAFKYGATCAGNNQDGGGEEEEEEGRAEENSGYGDDSVEHSVEDVEEKRKLRSRFSRAIKLHAEGTSNDYGDGDDYTSSEYARALDELPMTPSLLAMTPNSRALSVGQILLARALVSDILGEELDMSVLSSRTLNGGGENKEELAKEEQQEEKGSDTSFRPSRAHNNFSNERFVLPSPRTVVRAPILSPTAITSREAAGDGVAPSEGRADDKCQNSDGKIAGSSEEEDREEVAIGARAKKAIVAAGNGNLKPVHEVVATSSSLSPNSATLLSKSELQKLINARVSRSISERSNGQISPDGLRGNLRRNSSNPTRKSTLNAASSSSSTQIGGNGGFGRIVTAEEVAAAAKREKRRLNRFNAVYRTSSGQTISFKDSGKNTPPTPTFGGDRIGAAVDVEWSAYEAVYPSSPPSYYEQGQPHKGGTQTIALDRHHHHHQQEHSPTWPVRPKGYAKTPRGLHARVASPKWGGVVFPVQGRDGGGCGRSGIGGNRSRSSPEKSSSLGVEISKNNDWRQVNIGANEGSSPELGWQVDNAREEPSHKCQFFTFDDLPQERRGAAKSDSLGKGAEDIDDDDQEPVWAVTDGDDDDDE